MILDLQGFKEINKMFIMFNLVNIDEIWVCWDVGIDLFLVGMDQIDNVCVIVLIYFCCVGFRWVQFGLVVFYCVV